jgi:hypothetical protein
MSGDAAEDLQDFFGRLMATGSSATVVRAQPAESAAFHETSQQAVAVVYCAKAKVF